MVKFSIIICSEKFDKFLTRSIKSCVEQNFKDFEIIVVLQKKNYQIKKIFNTKKLKIILIHNHFRYPVQRQMYGIKTALKFSRGKIVCLLDHDDYFLKNKLYQLSIIKKKNLFIMDQPILFFEDSKKIKKKIKINLLKKSFFYKNFINKWPSISCTSGITVERKIINEFFNISDPFFWKHLAIDIQLAIYADLYYEIFFTNYQLTYKSIHKKNLDKQYSNFLSSKYWTRRNEQHDFYLSLSKTKYFKGFDFYLTKIICFFLKNN